METFSALLALCAQRPVTRSFDVFFDLRPNKRLSKQSWGDLRRHRAHYDVTEMENIKKINYCYATMNFRIFQNNRELDLLELYQAAEHTTISRFSEGVPRRFVSKYPLIARF